jgi:hypothetical protein
MKTKTLKAKIIGVSILAAVSIAVIAAILYVGPIDVAKPQEDDPYEKWNKSGPFAINKFEYKLGENIFISVNGLQPTDVGNIVFIMPNGTTVYAAIPFNGGEKDAFNQYIRPSISGLRHICSVDDLIGEWTTVFDGTNQQPLKFRITNQTLLGEESYFQRVC